MFLYVKFFLAFNFLFFFSFIKLPVIDNLGIFKNTSLLFFFKKFFYVKLEFLDNESSLKI